MSAALVMPDGSPLPDPSEWSISQCVEWLRANVPEPDFSALDEDAYVEQWREAVRAEAKCAAEEHEVATRPARLRAEILAAVAKRLDDIVAQHGGFNSAHEALAVMEEEVHEFKTEVWKKRRDRSPKLMRDELLDVAAVALKAAIGFGH